jgi:hypothetical protein
MQAADVVGGMGRADALEAGGHGVSPFHKNI